MSIAEAKGTPCVADSSSALQKALVFECFRILRRLLIGDAHALCQHRIARETELEELFEALGNLLKLREETKHHHKFAEVIPEYSLRSEALEGSESICECPLVRFGAAT